MSTQTRDRSQTSGGLLLAIETGSCEKDKRDHVVWSAAECSFSYKQQQTAKGKYFASERHKQSGVFVCLERVIGYDGVFEIQVVASPSDCGPDGSDGSPCRTAVVGNL
jgi:hypothetical protein